jgi:hypothetical protein
MSRHTAVGTIIIAFAVAAAGQYGTAPNNYYPDKYNGSTFTGVVAQTANDQVTLTYTKGDKTETFTGRFEAPCSVPSTKGGGIMPSDIPGGTVMTVFFNTDTKKMGGQKLKENVILAIALDNWHGQKIAEDKKKIYLCTGNAHVQFRAFE